MFYCSADKGIIEKTNVRTLEFYDTLYLLFIHYVYHYCLLYVLLKTVFLPLGITKQKYNLFTDL